MSNKLSLLVNFIGVDKMSNSLRSIMTLGKKGSRSLNELRGEGRKLESQLRDVRRELKGASGNVTGLIDRERQLERAIDKTNRELAERKRLYAIEGERRARIAKADQMMARGRENMMQGAGMFIALGAMGKAGMDYEKSLALIAQKTDLTDAQTRRLGNSLLAAARAAKQMPDNVLLGADFLAGKGFSVEQLEGAMPAIARFATAWDADIVDSSKAAFASINSLRVPINQTARALQIMGVAGKEGGFEVRDMAQHFPSLSAELATFGHEGLGAVSSLSAALQILEAQTGDGAQAATNLSNLMTFVKTERGIQRFQKFGVDIVAALKKAEKDGRDPLEALIDITNEATGGDKSKLAQLFSNQQAMKAILALTSQAEKYKEIRDAAFSAQGVTAAEFTRMSKTSAVNWEALKGSAVGAAAAMGTHLLPVMTTGMNMIARVTNAVGQWADRNPVLAKSLLYVVAGVAGFKLGLGALQFAFGGTLKPFESLHALVQKTGGWKHYFAMVKAGFLMLRGAALFMAKGMIKAGAKMLANPVILAIVALTAVIGGAAYLIYTHWDSIKAAFWQGIAGVQSAWEGLKGYLTAGFDWFMSLPGKMITIGKNIISGLIDGIMGAGSRVWQALKDVVMGGVNKVKDWLGIKSPSRVFMEIGGHTGAGLAIGMERQRKRVGIAAGRLAKGAVAGASLALTPAAIAAPSGGQSGGAAAPINVTFNLNKETGESDEEFARRIMRKLEAMMKQKARREYEDGI